MNIKHLFVHSWKILEDRISVLSYRVPKRTEVVRHIVKFCPVCGKTVTTEKVIFEMEGNPDKRTLAEMAEYYQKKEGATFSNYGVF